MMSQSQYSDSIQKSKVQRQRSSVVSKAHTKERRKKKKKGKTIYMSSLHKFYMGCSPSSSSVKQHHTYFFNTCYVYRMILWFPQSSHHAFIVPFFFFFKKSFPQYSLVLQQLGFDVLIWTQLCKECLLLLCCSSLHTLGFIAKMACFLELKYIIWPIKTKSAFGGLCKLSLTV